jgi:acetylornithine/succinyldiaminopimelate/putrescine aminotransferase
MTTVFHRAPRAKLPIAVAGEGIEIIDSEGKRYIDACGGAAVSCLGHSNQRVIDAIKQQAQQLSYAHTSFFSTQVAEELADHLIASAPQGLGHVYFVSGGSEARASVLRREGRNATSALHRTATELPRQYTRRTGDRRQCMASRAVSSHPHRSASREPVLRLPGTAGR